MLENGRVKTKEHATQASVVPMVVFQSNVIKADKKTLTRYLGVARIFDWREAKPPISRNDVIKIFQKEGLFTGQKYRGMEVQKQAPGLA